jgi:hypothetical protein
MPTMVPRSTAGTTADARDGRCGGSRWRQDHGPGLVPARLVEHSSNGVRFAARDGRRAPLRTSRTSRARVPRSTAVVARRAAGLRRCAPCAGPARAVHAVRTVWTAEARAKIARCVRGRPPFRRGGPSRCVRPTPARAPRAPAFHRGAAPQTPRCLVARGHSPTASQINGHRHRALRLELPREAPRILLSRLRHIGLVVVFVAARNVVVSVDVNLVKLQFEPVWLVVQRVRDAARQVRGAVSRRACRRAELRLPTLRASIPT